MCFALISSFLLCFSFHWFVEFMCKRCMIYVLGCFLSLSESCSFKKIFVLSVCHYTCVYGYLLDNLIMESCSPYAVLLILQMEFCLPISVFCDNKLSCSWFSLSSHYRTSLIPVIVSYGCRFTPQSVITNTITPSQNQSLPNQCSMLLGAFTPCYISYGFAETVPSQNLYHFLTAFLR